MSDGDHARDVSWVDVGDAAAAAKRSDSSPAEEIGVDQGEVAPAI